jgi:hypothetical protein
MYGQDFAICICHVLTRPGLWSEISSESRGYVLSAYLKIAQQIIDENASEPHRLSFIVMAAVEAQG